MKGYIFSIVLFFFSSGCIQVYAQNNKFDSRLVGVWSGSEKDEQMKGVQVNWVQHRFSDGRRVTYFTSTYMGQEIQSEEKGKWWVKNGKFYEKNKGALRPDIYSFRVIDENHILFKAIRLSTKFENQNYEFIDTRVVEEEKY